MALPPWLPSSPNVLLLQAVLPPSATGRWRHSTDRLSCFFFFLLLSSVLSNTRTHRAILRFPQQGAPSGLCFSKLLLCSYRENRVFCFFLCFHGERVSDRERQMLFLFIVCFFLLWLFLTSFLFCRLFVKLLHLFVLHNASGRVVCDGEQKSRNATSCVVHKRRLQTSALAEQLICRRTKQNKIHPLS